MELPEAVRKKILVSVCEELAVCVDFDYLIEEGGIGNSITENPNRDGMSKDVPVEQIDEFDNAVNDYEAHELRMACMHLKRLLEERCGQPIKAWKEK